MKTAIVAALLGCAASGAMAQELVGGALSVGYQTSLEDGVDASAVSVGGSGELALNRNFSLQGDLAYTSIDLAGLELDGYSVGAHGIFHASETTSLGFFLASENLEKLEVTSYGVEAGYGSGPMSVEGYFGVANVGDGVLGTGSDVDMNLFGVSGQYAIGANASLGVDFDRVSYDGSNNAHAVAINAAYGFESGVVLEAQLGTTSGEALGRDFDNSNFATMTATFELGKRGRAAFERRGLLDGFTGL